MQGHGGEAAAVVDAEADEWQAAGVHLPIRPLLLLVLLGRRRGASRPRPALCGCGDGVVDRPLEEGEDGLLVVTPALERLLVLQRYVAKHEGAAGGERHRGGPIHLLLEVQEQHSLRDGLVLRQGHDAAAARLADHEVAAPLPAGLRLHLARVLVAPHHEIQERRQHALRHKVLLLACHPVLVDEQQVEPAGLVLHRPLPGHLAGGVEHAVQPRVTQVAQAKQCQLGVPLLQQHRRHRALAGALAAHALSGEGVGGGGGAHRR